MIVRPWVSSLLKRCTYGSWLDPSALKLLMWSYG